MFLLFICSILIGAPTANAYYLDFNLPVGESIERPGVLFKCFARDPYTCFEINLDESGKNVWQLSKHN